MAELAAEARLIRVHRLRRNLDCFLGTFLCPTLRPIELTLEIIMVSGKVDSVTTLKVPAYLLNPPLAYARRGFS